MPIIELLEDDVVAAHHEAAKRRWGFRSFAVRNDEGEPLFLIQDYREGTTGDVRELREELILILGGSILQPRKAA